MASLIDSLTNTQIVFGYKKKTSTWTKEEPMDIMLLTRDSYQSGNFIGIIIDDENYGNIVRNVPESTTIEDFIERQKPNGWEFSVADNVNEFGTYMLGVMDKWAEEPPVSSVAAPAVAEAAEATS